MGDFVVMKSIVLIVCLLTHSLLYSQQGTGGAQAGDIAEETKNDLLAVVAGGVAGAILGLSTLSFVEEPKEHTRNILIGASIGIIAGVGYVGYKQANKSREMLYQSQIYKIERKMKLESGFESTSESRLAHFASKGLLPQSSLSLISFYKTWSF